MTVEEQTGEGAEAAAAADEDVWRQVVTVLLAFKRFSSPAIARALHVDVTAIEAVAAEPEVRDTAAALRRLLPKPRDVEEILMADAERNIRWLRRVREGKVDRERLGTSGRALQVRIDAAKALLDRQVPRRLSVMAPVRRVIDVTPAHLAMMEQVLALPDDILEGETDDAA